MLCGLQVAAIKQQQANKAAKVAHSSQSLCAVDESPHCYILLCMQVATKRSSKQMKQRGKAAFRCSL
jgi:hypothetical protein